MTMPLTRTTIWAVVVALAAVAIVTPARAQEKTMTEKPAINVTSHNQQGGITAYIVNIGRVRLEFNSDVATALANALLKGKPIVLHTVGSERDRMTALQYAQFLIDRGFPLRYESHSGMVSPPPDDQITFTEFPDRVVLHIAPRT